MANTEGEFRAVLDADIFRRVSLCASTEQTRYYLNGVFVDPLPGGGAQLVATNGHTLVAMRDANAQVENGPAIVRLGNAFLAECGKRNRKKPQPRKIVVSGDKARLEPFAEQFDFGSGPSDDTIAYQWTRTIIDGTYPDWRAVVPNNDPKVATTAQTFNAENLAIVSKALMAPNGIGGIRVIQNTDSAGPALVFPMNRLVDGFGVVMPMRGEDASMPAWFRRESEQKRAA